jgi:hypothetical protein
MELDLQSLFVLHVHSCTHKLRPRNPTPPHLDSYTRALITKYVHIKRTTVYAPRRNWDSPQPPTRRLLCPLPPVSGGREHSLARKGLGESQFRRGAYTVVLFICTYFVALMVSYCSCCNVMRLKPRTIITVNF